MKLVKAYDSEYLAHLGEPHEREYEGGRLSPPSQHLIEGIDNFGPFVFENKPKNIEGNRLIVLYIKINFTVTSKKTEKVRSIGK